MELANAGFVGKIRFALLLLLSIVVFGTATLALATTRKLNSSLALGGRIGPSLRYDFQLERVMFPGVQVSPDNRTVVFLADQTTSGVYELFSVPLGGGKPLRLNAPLPPGGSVSEFAIADNGIEQHVVYLADQREAEVYELFAVPIGGGVAKPLNSFLAAGGDVTNFVLSPDASTVIFRADLDNDEQFDLFSVPVDGSLGTRLNQRLSTVGDVQPDFAVSPDNQRVVYRYDAVDEDVYGLYSSFLTGGNSEDIGQGAGLAGVRSALDFVIAPSSQYVAYRGLAPDSSVNLFLTSISATPGEFAQLTSLGPDSAVENPSFGDIPFEDQPFPENKPYAFTPDSAEIVFIVDEIDGLYDLQSVVASTSSGAPGPILLSPQIDNDLDVTSFRISPTGNRIVFRADREDDSFGLISVLRDGGSPVLLPAVLPASADVREFEITPDGQRVVFRGDLNADERFELFSSPIDASAGMVTLNGNMAANGDVHSFAIAATSQRVVYSADQEIDGVDQLYTVLATGGTPVRLNQSLVNGGNVTDFVLNAAGTRVLFSADIARDEVFNLVSVPLTGPASAAVTLTDTTATTGDVTRFALSADGNFAVFTADQTLDEVFELFSARLDGGPPTRLNGVLGTGGDVVAFTISPTSRRVVYLADQDGDQVFELWSVAIDGGPVVKLNPPLVANGDVESYQISPDGTRVVYLADQTNDQQFDLWSVPIGGGTAVRLSELTPGWTIFDEEWRISPNSERVVYIADQEGQAQQKLYSVAIGGGTSVTLNSTLIDDGDVTAFEISADNSRVVYSADQNIDDKVELFSVPLLGGTATALTPGMPATADVDLGENCTGQRGQWHAQHPGGEAPFLISPDSKRVVYCADRISDELFELFSVPINAGNTVKLNIPPGAGGGVTRFEISGNSSRVVFLSISLVDGEVQEQLYSAATNGNEFLPVALNAPFTDESIVEQFAISADSGSVAFVSDRTTFGQFELWSVPTSGGTPSKRSGKLPANGDVRQFFISKDSSRLLYRADQLSDNVFELFVNQLNGTNTPFVVSEPMVPNGDVRSDFLSNSSSTEIVYRADLEINGVEELFGVRFPSEAPLPLRIAFTADTTVNEKDGSASLSIGLDRAANVPITVFYTVTGGTATGNGFDYLLPQGSVTFAPGETLQTVLFSIVDDTLAEGPETIFVTLSEPSEGAVLGSKSVGVVVIEDDDSYQLYLPMLRKAP